MSRPIAPRREKFYGLGLKSARLWHFRLRRALSSRATVFCNFKRALQSQSGLFHAFDFLGEPLEPRVLLSQVNIPVTNTNDMGAGSLRNAIIQANALPASDLANIQFKIPGTGVHTINLKSGLPFITAEVDILGQTDSKGNPLTELNGQNAGLFSDGLFLDPNNTSGPASEITGLIINRFGSAGIDVHGGKAIIFGCRIGTNAAGTAALPNKQEGILLEGNHCAIGEPGAGPAFQVLISGNKDDGIHIVNDNNTVENCLIGTDVTGTKPIGNQGWGIEDNGTNNDLGENVVHGGLVVSANAMGGIHLTGSGTTVDSSKIGTDITGNKALGNKGNGVELDSATNCAIGDVATVGSVFAGNIISANTFAGVVSLNSPQTFISGNRIGTNAAGTAALGNGEAGVFIGSEHNVVQLNVISANGFDGIVCEEDAFKSDHNSFHDNMVGTDVTGTKPLGNKGDGILLNIGTNNIVQHNIIAFNTVRGEDGYGVDIMGHAAFGNKVTQNSIFSNGRLGINLGEGTGKALPNDNKDGDTGPNHFQNYPVLSSAKKSGPKVTIKGTLNSNPKSSFTIELFASPAADPTGFGEGKFYLGMVKVTTDASGNVSFTATLTAPATGSFITATATSSGGDTSEFSKAIKMA
jgi:Right handed beta helix region